MLHTKLLAETIAGYLQSPQHRTNHSFLHDLGSTYHNSINALEFFYHQNEKFLEKIPSYLKKSLDILEAAQNTWKFPEINFETFLKQQLAPLQRGTQALLADIETALANRPQMPPDQFLGALQSFENNLRHLRTRAAHLQSFHVSAKLPELLSQSSTEEAYRLWITQRESP